MRSWYFYALCVCDALPQALFFRKNMRSLYFYEKVTTRLVSLPDCPLGPITRLPLPAGGGPIVILARLPDYLCPIGPDWV